MDSIPNNHISFVVTKSIGFPTGLNRRDSCFFVCVFISVGVTPFQIDHSYLCSFIVEESNLEVIPSSHCVLKHQNKITNND